MKNHAKKCASLHEIKHESDCVWINSDCEYKETHKYCPHAEHACTCPNKFRNECDCDGYHTFTELYDHRIELWIALCKKVQESFDEIDRPSPVWRSKVHSDGSSFDGWFILGMYHNYGVQITYHIPMIRWDDCEFAIDLAKAPTFDGHTPDDVINRLKEL